MSRRFPTIGILGGGQLGRMTALAAIRMGLGVRTLSPVPAGPVSGLGTSMVGNWTDPEIMAAFIEGCSVVTVESEWSPADVAEDVSGGMIPVWPSARTIHHIRHKGRQKTLLASAGVPQADFALCRTQMEAEEAARRLGYPVLAKRYEGSYDGYGNALIGSRTDFEEAWKKLSGPDGVLIEAFVPFVRELAVMIARSPSGETRVYPVVHSEQKDHRCHAVSVPAVLAPQVEEEAIRVATVAANTVESVGVLGVELFELEDGTVLLNELAPRPHNTGHYSIEACHTSQFENHIRAILDWPLGNPGLRVPSAVMINVLGRRAGEVDAEGMTKALEVEGASVHLYGKQETRPLRKMGHVTVTASSVLEAREAAELAVSHLLV